MPRGKAKLTDRAYRYRARRTPPHGAKRCAFCGSTRNVVPDHIDGHEENGAADNLMWLCKSCNTRKGVAMRNAGIGRLTHQYNPTKSGGAATIGEWIRAVGSIIPHKGEKYSGENYGLVAAMPVHEAVRMIRATPAHRRSEFASKLRHNPPGKTKFDRCVKAVTKHGGAYDPRAVCGAMRARGELNAATAELPKGARVIRRKDMHMPGTITVGKVVSSGKKWALVRFPGGFTNRISSKDLVRVNPADSSAEAYERFHGRKPTQYVKVTKRIHHHANLWSVGDLRKLKIKSIDGRSVVSLSSFKGSILAANEEAFRILTREGHARLTQLFIEGGDQSVDLRSFGIDPEDAHELETLGKATLIDYKTVKVHLGDEGGDAVYRHKFRSTRAGDKHVTLRVARYPDVIYRVLDKQLEFSGGSYEIRSEGIDK